MKEAEKFAETMKAKYANPFIHVDRTKPQCSKCHMRDGHKRSRCINGECAGPESCNDVDRHPSEKKQLTDAVHNVRIKEKQLLNLKEELKAKEIAMKETQSSFKHRIESTLINTNLNKYTFMTNSGRAVRQTTINNDIHILEKHYRNRVPNDLENESKKFQEIINTFNKENQLCGQLRARAKTIDPTRKKLNEMGVVFPSQNSDSCSDLNILLPKSLAEEHDQLMNALKESAFVNQPSSSFVRVPNYGSNLEGQQMFNPQSSNNLCLQQESVFLSPQPYLPPETGSFFFPDHV